MNCVGKVSPRKQPEATCARRREASDADLACRCHHDSPREAVATLAVAVAVALHVLPVGAWERGQAWQYAQCVNQGHLPLMPIPEEVTMYPLYACSVLDAPQA